MEKLFKISFLFILILGSAITSASDNRPVLDMIRMQLSVEGWVNNQKPLVLVEFNAKANPDVIVKTKHNFQGTMKRIYQSTWHIRSIRQTKDASGLAQLIIRAEARIPEKELDGVRKNVKKWSKPGATYQVKQVNYKPMLSEVSAKESELRQALYRLAQAEKEKLNGVYTGQSFKVHQLNFFKTPSHVSGHRAKFDMVSAGQKAPGSPLSVDNKLVLSAHVTFAAIRDN